jgi:hypothetical protein
MTLAKTIAIGAAAFGLAAGGALAGEGGFGMNDSMIVLEPAEVAYYDVYGVDENRDGIVDSYLLLEQSDTRG